MSKVVLVVDDSPTFRQVVKLALQKSGFEVAEAGDGLQALQSLGDRKLSAIVCDLNMPQMNGFEFVAKLKQSPTHKFVPVIMLTTESRAEYKDQGRAVGVRAWMVKPFQPTQLVDALKRVIV